MFFRKRNINCDKSKHPQLLEKQPSPLSSNLKENLQNLQLIYNKCSDVVFRPFLIGGTQDACLVYFAGLSNIEEMDAGLLNPLMRESTGDLSLDLLLKKRISVTKVKKVQTVDECVENISSGNPVLLIDRKKEGFTFGLAKWDSRSIEEPPAEVVIRGPREGFTESLGVNMSLLRRKIKSPKLKIESRNAGHLTQTQLAIVYIEGIVDEALLREVNKRLDRIDLDGVLESANIEEWMEDDSFSPFPQILNTERPDVIVSNLLEGRVAILIDGTPFALVVPATFFSMLQSSEDYYQRFMIGSAIRWVRYLFLMISVLLPSLYVAVMTFHQEMLPTTLMLSIASSREQVPFPALIEAFMMELTFEGLREAGVRLPKQVGAAVSIVGALVIGQAAVEAGLVSAPMVMVVAITGIASFTIPRYAAGIALRMLRFPIMFLAGTLGLLGIMLGLLIILIHLCHLRSFGVPYLTPMAPLRKKGLKDVLWRAPVWAMNTASQANDQKPNHPPGDP